MKRISSLLAVCALALVMVGCSGSDPAPAVGDADVTKDMPANQGTPGSAAARAGAEPAAPNTLPLDR